MKFDYYIMLLLIGDDDDGVDIAPGKDKKLSKQEIKFIAKAMGLILKGAYRVHEEVLRGLTYENDDILMIVWVEKEKP